MNPKKLLFIIVILSVVQCDRSPELEEGLPNIIILLADDLGYGDLGSYGGVAATPNLDQMAKEGMRFTDFYAAAPNCSPSRVGLLTGRSPSKVGMYNYTPHGHPMHLRDEEITIAEMVKKKSYQTGHFGKWHVGCLPQDSALNQPQPDEQGFDFSFGTAMNATPSHFNPVNFVRNGEKTGELKGYSCQIVVNEAIQWLDSISENPNPFLIYIAFHEPHKKVASPPELTAKYERYPTQDAEYFANVENLDLAIGKLLKALVSRQLEQNTLIVFASDNGSYRNGSNGNLLGGKSFVYEGGIRVPGIMYWKGKIKRGQTITEPACLIDLMPTICELTGVQHPNPNQLNGISLVPLFSQNNLQRSKPLSWFFYRTTPEIAMRIGDYTILGRDRDTCRYAHSMTQSDMDYIKNLTLEDFELYHLKTDPSQSNNLNYNELDIGKQYKIQLVNRLEEIQKEGYYWKDLPLTKGTKKQKSEWRKLRPEGFSN